MKMSDTNQASETFPMTKEQARTKLDLLPLLVPVAVDYGTDEAENPVIEFSFSSVPGPGDNYFSMPLAPTEQNVKDLVNNLPLAPIDRLASLAIMLAPPLPT